MNDYQNNFSNGYQEPYKAVIEPRGRSKAWSVAALILSIASIICCCFSWVGLVAGVLGIVFAVISRRSLGYFDGLSVAAIIVSIFGIVFSALIIYSSWVLINDPEFMDYYNELLEQIKNSSGDIEVFSFIRGYLR